MVLTVRPYKSTQTKETQSQTVKIPISFSLRRCSGLCSGLKGDLTHIPNDVEKPDEKAD
jgi:hypothetical protein